MKLTFSKTLLATMVFASLTACSSGGGGGGSSEPTTSSSSASNERVSTPLVPNSTSTASLNDSSSTPDDDIDSIASSSDSNSTSDDSITVPTVQNNSSTTNNVGSNSILSIAPNQNNTASASPTASTFKLDSAGKPTGVAIYKGDIFIKQRKDPFTNNEYFSSGLGDKNEITLIADFDSQRIKGSAYFDVMEYNRNEISDRRGYDLSDSIEVGSGKLTLDDAKLAINRKSNNYHYHGVAKGSVTLKDEYISDLKGYYYGNISQEDRYEYTNTEVDVKSASKPSISLRFDGGGRQ